MVLTQPVFKALKKLNFHTTLITKKKMHPVVRNNKDIDRIVFIEDIDDKFISDFHTDYLVDLQMNVSSQTIYRQMKTIRKKVIRKYYFKRWLFVNTRLYLKYPDVITRYRDAVEQTAKIKLDLEKLEFSPAPAADINVKEPYVTLSLISKWKTKSYPYALELVDLILNNTDFNIVILGENDLEISSERVINIKEDFPIDKSAFIIRNSRLMVTVDSLWMHISIGMKIPTIAIFGATSSRLGFVSRYNKPDIIMEKFLFCRPCTAIGNDICPVMNFQCMKSIKPEEVFKIIRNECNS